MMVVVGDKVQFDPMKEIVGLGVADLRGRKVTGEVVMVNYDHKWFSVEYDNKQRTSFNFWDIGKSVTICG
jgi:hypothetical protein